MGIKVEQKRQCILIMGLCLCLTTRIFNGVLRNPMEFYKATLNKNDEVMFERNMNTEVVEEMIEKIIFEVWLYEFKQQYVGKTRQHCGVLY